MPDIVICDVVARYVPILGMVCRIVVDDAVVAMTMNVVIKKQEEFFAFLLCFF
mgnify:CR=1 FL=1